MRFRNRLLLHVIPLSLLPVLAVFISFFMIVEEQLIENKEFLMRYTSLILIEQTEEGVRELKAQKLYDSDYFRLRMYDRIINSGSYQAGDLVFISERESLNIVSGTVDINSFSENNPDINNLIKFSAEETDVIIISVNSEGHNSEYLLFSQFTPGDDFIVSVMNPLSVVVEPLLSAIKALVPIILVLSITVMIIIFRMSMFFTKPLVSLTEGAEKIRNGELDISLRAEQNIDELRILVGAFNNMTESLYTEMTTRYDAEQELLNSLDEKDVLLKEVHHRVKNNMAIISSLLSLQSSSIDQNMYVDQFQAAINRIDTMALVHEKIYQSDELACIDIESYLNDLVPTLVQSISGSLIQYELDIEPLIVSLDQIIPLGLIFNELITNSVKHGLIENEINKINIELSITGDDVAIIYTDSGKGPSKDLATKKLQSFGFQLIVNLTEQLNGSYEIITDSGKNSQKIVFPKADLHIKGASEKCS